MQPFDYFLLQLELEGIQRLGEHRMRRLSSAAGDFPLALVACTSDGQRCSMLDERLPAALRGRLLKSGLQSFETQTAVGMLERTGLAVTACQFRTYTFPDDRACNEAGDINCLPSDDPRVVDFGFGSLPGRVFAAVRDGMVVSACGSSRQNAMCAEAWVVTCAEYRRQGLGRQVVSSWARHQQLHGITPFYSHDVRNTGSSLLAQSLGLSPVFEELVIEDAC